MNKLRFLLFIFLISYLQVIYSQNNSTCLKDKEIDKIIELVFRDFISKSTQPDTLHFNIIPIKWDYVLGNQYPFYMNPNYFNDIKNNFEIDSLLNQYFCGYKYLLQEKLNYQNKLDLLSQIINLNELNIIWNFPNNIPITKNFKQYRSLSLTIPYCIDDRYIIIGYYLYNGFRFEQSGIILLINNNEWIIDKKIGCWKS